MPDPRVVVVTPLGIATLDPEDPARVVAPSRVAAAVVRHLAVIAVTTFPGGVVAVLAFGHRTGRSHSA